jgi:hypothetical protein
MEAFRDTRGTSVVGALAVPTAFRVQIFYLPGDMSAR